MPRIKADVNIGKRMHEEIYRLFPSYTSAANALRCDRKCISLWSTGTTPDTLQLARLHYLGGDVIYVLTGNRRAEDA